MIRNK